MHTKRGLTVCFLLSCPQDEHGKDQGINIRQKVKELVEFAQDDDRLREERKKAKKNKDKYVGVSSDSVGGFRYSEYQGQPWPLGLRLLSLGCVLRGIEIPKKKGGAGCNFFFQEYTEF